MRKTTRCRIFFGTNNYLLEIIMPRLLPSGAAEMQLQVYLFGENTPGRGNLLFVASGTLADMEGHLAIMAQAAGLALEHFRHDHFSFALLHGKWRGMAQVTGKFRMALMVEINILHRGFIGERIRPARLGGLFIRMAAVAVVKGGRVLFGMTDKT